MMQNMNVSWRTMWAGFLGLKVTCVTGVSLSNHRECSPCFCSFRLHSVYSFRAREYSKIYTQTDTESWRMQSVIISASSLTNVVFVLYCVSVYLLIGVHHDEATGHWVDGYGSGTGTVHWNCTVKLQTGIHTNISLLLSVNQQTEQKTWTHLQLVEAVHMNLTVCVCRSEPSAVVAGSQQVDRLPGACTSDTRTLYKQCKAAGWQVRCHCICMLTNIVSFT